MEEKKNVENIDNKEEYITEKEAKTVKELFKRYLKEYKEKDANMTDQERLEQLFKKEIPETTTEQAKQDAKEIVD